jgi:hypothetical protein
MYFTLETLLNHVFEDLRKPKAPNSGLRLAAVQDTVKGMASCGIHGGQVVEAELGRGVVCSEAKAGFRRGRVSSQRCHMCIPSGVGGRHGGIVAVVHERASS